MIFSNKCFVSAPISRVSNRIKFIPNKDDSKLTMNHTLYKTAIADNETHHQQNLEKIAELAEQLAIAEPEKQLAEDQLEQAQMTLLEAEEQFSQQQHQWRNQELEFNQRKQQAQSCHGKIQSLMSMQLRTQQRIGELKDELKGSVRRSDC